MAVNSSAVFNILRAFNSPNVITDLRFLKRRQKPIPGRMCSSTFARKITITSQYCLNSVKKNDHENFLATLLLPHEARPAAFAIRAFNVELAQIQDITTQPLMAKVRLEFWRETLTQIYKNSAPKQPIALELQRAVQKYKLSKRWLQSLIDSREDHLENKQFTSVEEVEEYSEKSNSVIYYLVLQSLGVDNVNADHVGSHLGKAEGIVRLIRGAPHLASKRTVLLPRNVMVQHKVSQEDIIRGNREQKVKDVIFDIASSAHHHIEHAKDLMKDVPREAKVGLLPHVAISTYLRSLQKVDFDVFDSSLQKRNQLLPLQLWWAKFRKL